MIQHYGISFALVQIVLKNMLDGNHSGLHKQKITKKYITASSKQRFAFIDFAPYIPAQSGY